MKVGDYVRTKDGVIAKITDIIEDFSIDCDRDVFHAFCNWRPDVMEIPWYYKEEYIIKSSPDIIDLIEVGDIIKGKDNHLFEVYAVGSDCVYINNLEEFIFANEIKSIVTKEQFESMEYKVC